MDRKNFTVLIKGAHDNEPKVRVTEGYIYLNLAFRNKYHIEDGQRYQFAISPKEGEMLMIREDGSDSYKVRNGCVGGRRLARAIRYELGEIFTVKEKVKEGLVLWVE